jgi:hypothetical protein
MCQVVAARAGWERACPRSSLRGSGPGRGSSTSDTPQVHPCRLGARHPIAMDGGSAGFAGAKTGHGARRSAALLPHPRPLLRCCSRASPLPICPRCLTYSAPHNWGGKGAPLRCSTCEWPWNWRDFANLNSLQNSRGGRGGCTGTVNRLDGDWRAPMDGFTACPGAAAPTASRQHSHCSKFTRPHQCRGQSPGTPANVMSCFPPQVFSL